MSDLGHNPNASANERLWFRQQFSEQKGNAANIGSAPPSQSVPGMTSIDMGELRKNLREIGLEIVPIGDKPIDPGGYATNREEKLIALGAENARLITDNANLKQRSVDAEAIAAATIKDIQAANVHISTLESKIAELTSAKRPAKAAQETKANV